MVGRILSSEVKSCVGREVRIAGWVHRIRNLGGVRFLIVRDRAGLTQVVIPPQLDLGNMGCEWVVAVTGVVRAEPRAPGGIEVHAEEVTVIAHAELPALEVFKPLAVSQPNLDTLLAHRAVSLRIPEVLDVFRVEAEVLRAFRAHLNGQGFTEIATPKLVLAGAEGGSAVFEVKYFERAAYLAQSPQFYKQIMVGSGLERVFEAGHVYRAEKSETTRHLTEYVSLDFEMGFIESEQDVMRVHSGLIAAIFEAVGGTCGGILARRGIALPRIAEIPQIGFPEAARVLADKFGKKRGLEGDLDTEGERFIGQWAEKELGSELLFVTGYHVERRPTYTMPDVTHPPLTRSFDLLFRGVEITTGGQRIHDHSRLVESIRSRGLNPADYSDYLATFKHGMCPHGGMGMGLERLVMQMLRLSNLREASLFPRDRNRLTP